MVGKIGKLRFKEEISTIIIKTNQNLKEVVVLLKENPNNTQEIENILKENMEKMLVLIKENGIILEQNG